MKYRQIAERAGALFLTVGLSLGVLLAGAVQPAAANSKYAAIVMDGVSGKVLHSRSADSQRYPASLTKMMTLYLLFEALEQGKITLQSEMRVSAHAAAQEPTKLYLKSGTTIAVETAIKAIVIRSANDVAVVIAEALGGTENAFARLMTSKAHELGMTQTTFRNASGLPNASQVTTARDMATLGRRVAYDFPDYYRYFALPSFTYNDRLYKTHDNLLGTFDGTDGIKTGYTRASGFNLTSSVVRGNVHLVGVVMGGRTAKSRDAEMMQLLNTEFERTQSNPGLVAYANVPWNDKAGPKVNPFANTIQRISLAALPPEEIAIPQAKPVAELRLASVENNASKSLLSAVTPAVYMQDDDISEGLGMDGGNSVPASAVLIVPARKPRLLTALEMPTEEQGDIGGPSMPAPHTEKPLEATGMNQWAVQIGAFSDEAVARSQLARYAENAIDLIGQADRVVMPIESATGGHLYRARFGYFLQNEAHQICRRMTQLGQTCFVTEIN